MVSQPQVVTTIQEYAFKRGFKKDANQRVVEALKACFGIDINVRDEEYRLSYGALKTMTIRVAETLLVDTEPSIGVPEAVMIDTNARFRCFLEKATGYTAKQRAKKAQEAVKRAKQG
ncbi:MAG: DUF5611 family protein [Halobacteriota archaeon]